MIKQFHEIEEFFERDKFSENELEEFKTDLKNKYQDRSIFNQAMALVSMKLLVFSLKPSKHTKQIAVKKSKQKIQLENTPKKSKNTKAEKLEEEFDKRITLEINSFRGKTLAYTAHSLNYTVPKFIIALKQQGYNFKDGDILTSTHIHQIRPFLLIHLKKLYQVKLKDKPKIYLDEKGLKKKAGSVYDELKTYGLGKLIYIRSK